MLFCDLGRFAPWVALSLGRLELGPFRAGSFRVMGRYVLGSFSDGASCM